MNTLAGWGFRTPEALERFARGTTAELTPMQRLQQRWVTPEKLAAYAATLHEVPSLAEVMQHFRCCYASAIKHRRKVIDIIAKRGKA